MNGISSIYHFRFRKIMIIIPVQVLPKLMRIHLICGKICINLIHSGIKRRKLRVSFWTGEIWNQFVSVWDRVRQEGRQAGAIAMANDKQNESLFHAILIIIFIFYGTKQWPPHKWLLSIAYHYAIVILRILATSNISSELKIEWNC